MVGGCDKPPELPPVPKISSAGVNQSLINATSDTLVISFNYEDGDGDLGDEDITNAWIIDSRTSLPLGWKIPVLNSTGVPQAISGTIWFTLAPGTGIECQPDPPGRTHDTVSYEIYVRDQAGHESNHIFTEDIFLECQ
jgi:hypothetical protein